MVCSKKLKSCSKFSKVLIQVLVVKLCFSGFDVFSDGSTAAELKRLGSPLAEVTRFVKVHP